MAAIPRCTGAILAGGRSARMGGGAKAFARLAGTTLLDRVVTRLRPQCDALWLCVDVPGQAFEASGLPLVTDLVRSHRGPLTGLCSALRRLAGQGGEWLLLAPCDAPFLPPDLAARLLAAAEAGQRPVACARYGGHAQPTFSAWRVSVYPQVEAAVLQRGHGGLMRMLDELPHALVDWPEQQPPPFYNVNTPSELAQAALWLDPGGNQD